MNKDRLLIFIIASGLTIRLILIFLPGFSIDINDWFAWAMRLNEVGYTKFYSNQVFSDYTPGYMYVLSLLGFLRNLLQLDSRSFYLLLKIPAILAEITLSILIYRGVTKSLSLFYGRLSSTFILLNPALIFNSSVWGQIDSILALSLYLAIHYLSHKQLVLSSIMLSIAFLIKPQAIALFPIFLLFLIRNFTIRDFIKLTMPAILLIFTLSLPFFPSKPFSGLFNLIINTANQYPYTSLFAYNFWGALGFWISDNHIWNNFSYQIWGYILFVGYWIVVAYLYLKKKISLYSLAALATLGFFFLPTRVHERYLYPAIPFLILVAALLKSHLLWVLTVILSLIHFLNLYYVYVYYNEFYLKMPKLLYNPTLYNLLDTQSRSLSFLSTIIFVLISMLIIKLDHELSKV